MKTETKVMLSLQGAILGVLIVALYLIFTNYTPTYEVEVYPDHTVWHTTEKPKQEFNVGDVWYRQWSDDSNDYAVILGQDDIWVIYYNSVLEKVKTKKSFREEYKLFKSNL